MIRLLTVLAGAMLAVWASASPAWAYDTPISRIPADQEIVQSAPQAVATYADGHPISGTFFFTPKSAATQLPPSPQSSPPATTDQAEPTRMPGWLKLAIGAVAIIFGITVARRASGRGNAGSPP